MNSLILRTISQFLLWVLLIFSLFILIRGHNEPGGGFAGGLIAASAFSLYLIAHGPDKTRKILRIDFRHLISLGLCCTVISGIIGLLNTQAFLTGVWFQFGSFSVGSPLLFDLGVYFIVLGSILKIIISLEEKD